MLNRQAMKEARQICRVTGKREAEVGRGNRFGVSVSIFRILATRTAGFQAWVWILWNSRALAAIFGVLLLLKGFWHAGAGLPGTAPAAPTLTLNPNPKAQNRMHQKFWARQTGPSVPLLEAYGQ